MVKEADLSIRTQAARELVDITEALQHEVRATGIATGLCHVFVAGATAAIVIHEGDDPELKSDLLDLLDRVVPEGRWRHDRIDDNGAAHLRSAWLSPAETVPVRGGALALGTWQRVFLCEFDGPRHARPIRVTVMGE
jgi:secondary thiamine-phosphate synthase enzyme